MVRPLAGLAVGLQAVAEHTQQAADRVETDAVAEFLQAAGQVAQALGRPQQRPFRIATRRRLDQSTQVIEQAWMQLAPGSWPAHAARRRHIGGATKLGQTTANRAPRNSRYLGDCLDAAKTCRASLRRCKSSPPALIEHRLQRLESQPNRRFVDHHQALLALSHTGNPLPVPRFKNSCTGP